MAKQIKMTYNGKEFTLEYNRYSVQLLEKAGIALSDIDRKPMTVLPLLFQGAFIMHHQNTPQSVIDKIFENCENKQKLLQALIVMYQEPVNTLLAEPESDEGNAKWTADW
jgi:hypothetical protein